MKKTTSSKPMEEDTLSAAAFKTHCLRIMDEVARRRLVTRDRRILAYANTEKRLRTLPC